MKNLKQLPDIDSIHKRLQTIFPEGVSDRNYVVREMSAKVVYVFLYINAVEGNDTWLAPKHVYRMTDEQSRKKSTSKRIEYRDKAIQPGFHTLGTRWYADNTREPIRDETIRDGLVQKGAVLIDTKIPTTSNKGRYYLQKSFADLFYLPETTFIAASQLWGSEFLSASALAKIKILKSKGGTGEEVTFPGGEIRALEAGPSSKIAKAIIEQFAPRFMHDPIVLWFSQSGNKVVLQDEKLMKDLGLPIKKSQLLPDMVIADLKSTPLIILFIEIVATDGPITEARKEQILEMTNHAGFDKNQIYFMSAFRERNAAPLKKRFDGLATDSAVWCMAEPDVLIWIGKESTNSFLPTKE